MQNVITERNDSIQKIQLRETYRKNTTVVFLEYGIHTAYIILCHHQSMPAGKNSKLLINGTTNMLMFY